MKYSSQKKADQLGMPHGTASNRLRKSIIFDLLKKSDKNFCFQCGTEIETEDELSIEHKIPYLDSTDPVDLFFSLDNIGFSHLSCNVAAARPRKRKHGIPSTYDKGCRCKLCTIANTECKRKQRNALKAHVEVATGS